MRIPLLFHELLHVTFSILVGLAFYSMYKFTGVSIWPVLIVALFGGVLIDLDHLYDYYRAFRWDFKLHKFLKGKAIRQNRRLYVLFHGYEYVFLLVWIVYNMTNSVIQLFIFTLAISSLVHLLTDATVNNVYIRTYSILYRLFYSFKSKHLIKGGI